MELISGFIFSLPMLSNMADIHSYSCVIFIYRFTIKKKLICQNQAMGIFLIAGTTEKIYAIHLFPKESCTRLSTSTCYHILAVYMSIVLADENLVKKVNLAQMRRNTCSGI